MSRMEISHGSVVFQRTDAIVNAANPALLGGGGVDGAIHDAAGPELYRYFRDLGCTCQPGEAIESPGFNLPAKHIIHTVGPIWREGKFNEPEILARCYCSCLDEAAAHECKSIAFCCISTGVFGYPLEEATRIALSITSEWLQKHETDMLVRFCCYSSEEFKAYRKIAYELKIRYSSPKMPSASLCTRFARHVHLPHGS